MGDESLYQAAVKAVFQTSSKDSLPKLVHYLRDVFHIENKDESLEDLKSISTKTADLQVEVVEASSLKSMDPNGKSDPYCTLIVVPSAKLTSEGLSKHILKITPYRTSTKMTTLTPKWNETFTLDVQDHESETLALLVWDQDDDTASIWEDVRAVKKPVGIVSVFRNIKSNLEKKAKDDDFIGLVFIPLKDLSATPLERWWELKTGQGRLRRSAGKILLRLSVIKVDEKDEDKIHQDYFNLAKSFYLHHIKESDPPEAHLPELAKNILGLFAKRNKLQGIVEKFIQTMVLLELATLPQSPVNIEVLLEGFTSLESEVESHSSWEVVSSRRRSTSSILLDHSLLEETSQSLITSPGQVAMLSQSANTYVHHLLQEAASGVFFPLVPGSSLPTINSLCRVIYKLHGLKLDNWNNEFRVFLAGEMRMRLKEDVQSWMKSNWPQVCESNVDDICPTMVKSTDLLEDLSVTFDADLKDFPFGEWNIDYFGLLSEILDDQLCEPSKKLISLMDIYQDRYKEFHVNIRDSSRTAIQFYLALKKFVNNLKKNLKDSWESLKLKDYESWFESCFQYLLETYKTECPRRISLAMKYDSNHVNEENGRESVVYVLNCLSGVVAEWRKLEFDNSAVRDSLQVKLTQVIYDASSLYANLLEESVSSTCVNLHYSSFFKKVGESISSLKKVVDYLEKLPSEMGWGQAEAEAELRAQLERAVEQLESSMHTMVRQCTESIKPRLRDYLRLWIKAHHQAKDCDKVLGYLDRRLQSLYSHLRLDFFLDISVDLWNFLLAEVKSGFQEGVKPEYAMIVQRHIAAVRDYLLSLDVPERRLQAAVYHELQNLLQLHGLSATELQLEYCWELSQPKATPGEYLGHLAIRLGYKQITKGTVDLIVEVVQAKNLPMGEDATLRSTMVRVELNPELVFPGFQPYTTAVQRNTQNPNFHERFHFPDLPKTVLRVKGAVIHFVLVDWNSTEGTGEIYFPLNSVSDMTNLVGLEYVPAHLLAFHQFNGHMPIYQVLEQRSQWDLHSKEFLKSRRSLVRTKSQKKKGCLPFRRRLRVHLRLHRPRVLNLVGRGLPKPSKS